MLKHHLIKKFLLLTKHIKSFLLSVLIVFSSSFAFTQEVETEPEIKQEPESILLHATSVFDGYKIRKDTSILIANGKISKIGARSSFEVSGREEVIDLGDAMILPGFIELHAHLTFQNVPADIVLQHGITTIRDLGGPVHQPYGGDGRLRVLTSGPIITAPHGYPIPMVGTENIAIAVATKEEARTTTRNLIKQGAVVIKIALEPGGEKGAPWSAHHDHGHGHGHNQSHANHTNHTDQHNSHAHDTVHKKPAWPLLPENIVKAIVDEAGKHDRKVSAHVAEENGVRIAISAGVQEWAHMPCDVIPESLLKKAVSQNVKIVTTLDTLSKCTGTMQNAATWTSLGGKLLYGAEVAHPDIPWGINAQELMFMRQMGKIQLVDVLQAATSKAGEHLRIPLLGTIQPGAPADIIAVNGDLTHSIKKLEYPGLVISGGKIIVHKF